MSEELDLALADQKRTLNLIEQLRSITQGPTANSLTAADIDARCNLLDDYWQRFSERDFLLQRHSEALKARTYFKINQFNEAMTAYLAAKAWYTQRVNDLRSTANQSTASNAPIASSNSSATVSAQAALEKSKLPRFDGNQREWETFKEKFTSLIRNVSTIDSVIKFQHLLNCLTGEAAEKLRGIKLTGANFDTAWNTLCRRYDNKYLRFTVQMQALSRMPAASAESVSHINQLLNTVNESINCLLTIGMIFSFTSSRANIQTFLEDRIRTLDLVEIDHNSSEKSNQSNQRLSQQKERKKPSFNKNQRTNANVATQKTTKSRFTAKCTCCGDAHFLSYCPKFTQASIDQRFDIVISAKLCHNCLNSGHFVDSCSSQGRCLVCGGKHHTKLHRDSRSAPETVKTASKPGVSTGNSTSTKLDSSSCYLVGSGRKVLLSTACVILQAPNGNSMTVRALLDTGAEESFISEHVVQSLALRRKPADVAVSGIGGSESVVARGSVNIKLKSMYSSQFSFNFSALILKRLTAMIPNTEVHSTNWSALKHLQLADPHFGQPGRIDCILNAEVYAAVLQPGIERGLPGTCIALQSSLGWILMGAVPSNVTNNTMANVFNITVDHGLTTAISRFWETEEVPFISIRSPEDEACYQHFRDTHSRDETGRYIVRLPFSQPPLIADSRGIAEACFLRLEKRLEKQPELATAYTAFMDEYSDLQHMEVVLSNEVTPINSFYLPHHPVFKRDRSNKLRVVFNASQKRNDGFSLNSSLHIGPKLQEDVLAIILRWSFFPIVFTCDIVKMFRQFLIHRDDADWQRILWRDSQEENVQTYRLLTVTYGTASAPFLSNACMLQLAEDEAVKFPLGSSVLQKNRYADDFFVGGDNVYETRLIRDQLIGILQAAGMEVGKWSSNNHDILADLDSIDPKSVNFYDQDIVSTLGISWNPIDDSFCFCFSQPGSPDRITKRSILSEIARLYDPIGWLSPVIIQAKILLQNLWLQGVEWDEPVSSSVEYSWNSFRQQLPDLQLIQIPRWFGSFHSSNWSIHGFCDASERAFAACIYVVVQSPEGFRAKLITAKSKVSPIKVISLPRLELCGASLLCRLIKYILSKLDYKPSSINCWSDSTVVLSWLRDHPSRWKSFVANRVSGIITTLPDSIWNHVRSAENPADFATRGLTPNQLRESTLWWNGPDWLQKSASFWPDNSEISLTTNLELKKANAVVAANSIVLEDYSDWFSKFSSVDKIIRVLAYVERWRQTAKCKANTRRQPWLSAAELTAGRKFMLRLVQKSAFSKDIDSILEKGSVPPSSPLRRLVPFIDLDGLLRVGGRLQNSFLSEDEKHPVILPSKSHVSSLIVRKAHIITMHGGPSLVQSYLLRQYWIIRGRNFVRNIVRSCVRCIRYKATTLEQQMAPLPTNRSRPARPFTFTGVDYAGPFWIKASSGRGQKAYKGYIALFICLVVRAVHIEVVSDYTSAAFLAAFRRFTTRRGLCKLIYSDNGTTFQGADSELQRLFSETSALSQSVASQIAQDGVEWTYIPPRAPNFGGLWEASVKSFKFHLKRVVGETKLTFEGLSTVTSMIEACLNSRPLSLVSSTEEDVAALTPGHFLIGSSLKAPPEPFIEINDVRSVSSRWHLLVLMRNHFWKRWSREFLAELQQRSKWLKPHHDIQVGDVVLFKDELTAPGKWPLGRITRLFPGKDGLCRVVTIKTSDGEYKRPINKLILLPVNPVADSHLAVHKV